MDLDQILESRLFPVVLVIGVLMFVLVFGGPALQAKIKDGVIEDLRTNYTPGPYAPGFDPDKVNPNFWSGLARQQQPLPVRQQVVPNVPQQVPQSNYFDSYPEAWNRQWEDSRN